MEKPVNSHVKCHSPLLQELRASACSECTSIDNTHNQPTKFPRGRRVRRDRWSPYINPSPDVRLAFGTVTAALERRKRTAAHLVREIERSNEVISIRDRERAKNEVGRIWRSQLVNRLLSQ